jgi:2-polyprenyl-6-methoxyphenol hydroxylase-like FAD-dependent oxidoreductase
LRGRASGEHGTATTGKVLIAGGGIGGLTLAIALRLAGADVEILEQAPELTPLGAGLLVQANAMLALRSIGLDQAVESRGKVIRRTRILREDGLVLSDLDMTWLSAEIGAPTVAIHRARLQAALLAELGGARLSTAARVVGYDDRGDEVTARLEGGAEISGALLVGADGLRSTVRRQLVGDGAPRYAGYTSWRGIAPLEVGSDGLAIEMWGKGLRFGMAGVGHGETYWFAVANAPEGERDDDSLAVVRDRFHGFGADVRKLLAATPGERVFRTDIHDRDPTAGWWRGRVALLGDAAHPTTPNLGQGGCMAIEDAVVLADALAAEPSPEGAFHRYESQRFVRTRWLVEESRRFGRIAQAASPFAVWARDLAVRLTPRRVLRARLARVLSFRP